MGLGTINEYFTLPTPTGRAVIFLMSKKGGGAEAGMRVTYQSHSSRDGLCSIQHTNRRTPCILAYYKSFRKYRDRDT